MLNYRDLTKPWKSHAFGFYCLKVCEVFKPKIFFFPRKICSISQFLLSFSCWCCFCYYCPESLVSSDGISLCFKNYSLHSTKDTLQWVALHSFPFIIHSHLDVEHTKVLCSLLNPVYLKCAKIFNSIYIQRTTRSWVQWIFSFYL